MCPSIPIGRLLRRPSCGAGTSVPAGRRSRSAATFSTPRSSVAATKSSALTGFQRARPCGVTLILCGSRRGWAVPGRVRPRRLLPNRVLTFGATGLLNALDAANGRLLWSRNMVTDLDAATPMWGFAASPLVVDDLVIIAAGGQLAAYALATGERRWVGPSGGDGYSSPHATTIDGVPQIVLTSACRHRRRRPCRRPRALGAPVGLAHAGSADRAAGEDRRRPAAGR